MRKKTIYLYVKLLVASIAIGLLSAVIFFSLKKATEATEHFLYGEALRYPVLFIVFPVLGLSVIYFLRIFLFKKKENKGIREILDAFKVKDPGLPFYKIPSHYINGFLTVVSGGSTGIEVSSVVGAAAIGSVVGNKMKILKKYRSGLICAGTAAAITVLFNSPLAGIFFAYEVMYKKVSRPFFILTLIATLAAWSFNLIIDEEPLFNFAVTSWNTYAIPYFILLGIISGLQSVYLTKLVIAIKSLLGKVQKKYLAALGGSILIGVLIYCLRDLYGEGYHAIGEIVNITSLRPEMLVFGLVLILLAKPLATSLTLASGGDGGVFAPSLFLGAFLGFLTAFVLNTYFDAGVMPVNFVIVGMASVLCASIQAPLTSIFLVCGITGSYLLIIPLTIGCILSRITSHLILPYSVYNYPLKIKT
jgi:CIC family chloride channel protein